MGPTYVAAALGILTAGAILWLVRRDHLHSGHALWWLAVAGGALVVGLAPGFVDWLGHKLGVHYPPMLLVLVALAALVLRLLQVDVDSSRRERRMRRMIQKVAILELELQELRAELDAQRAARDQPATSADGAASNLRKVVG